MLVSGNAAVAARILRLLSWPPNLFEASPGGEFKGQLYDMIVWLILTCYNRV